MLASKIATTSRLLSDVVPRKQLRKFFGNNSIWKKFAFSAFAIYDAAKAEKIF